MLFLLFYFWLSYQSCYYSMICNRFFVSSLPSLLYLVCIFTFSLFKVNPLIDRNIVTRRMPKETTFDITFVFVLSFKKKKKNWSKYKLKDFPFLNLSKMGLPPIHVVWIVVLVNWLNSLCRYIQCTSAASGEGLYEGLDWLSSNIFDKAAWFELFPIVSYNN